MLRERALLRQQRPLCRQHRQGHRQGLASNSPRKYSKELGVHLDLRLVPFTSHVPFGKVISATPNGRWPLLRLSDGSSASHGADVNGPTAVLLSNFATKNYDYRERAARLLNIKLTPKCCGRRRGHREAGRFHQDLLRPEALAHPVQRHQRRHLLAAQKEPEKYRSLIVRIAGYSAYFCDLSNDLQDDLIARTEHECP